MVKDHVKPVLVGLRDEINLIYAKVSARLHKKEIDKPVFILGCGRSGTTILGTALSQHPQITYLNEQRHLWQAVYPQTDIWSNKANYNQGKLTLTANDTSPEKNMMLRRIFHKQVVRTGRPQLVEKLPINNFRVGFIQEIFPDALYIHILRHGIEVARSIERYEQDQGWFSNKAYRLELLKQYAAQNEDTAGLFDECDNSYEMGLFEWRLSLDSLYAELTKLPDSSLIEITYDELISDATQTLNQILNFMNLPMSNDVTTFATENIYRRNPKVKTSSYTNKELQLGGKWLKHI